MCRSNVAGLGRFAIMMGARVRQAIANAGRTQASVADEIGLATHKLSKSLSGARTFRDAEVDRLARALSVSREYLLSGGTGDQRENCDLSTPRDRILDAAADLIATQGIHVVRIADIAQACGVSTGTVHYYFPTRDDVLTAALQHYAQRMFTRLEGTLSRIEDPSEQLRYLIDSQLPTDPVVRDEWSVWVQFWTEAVLIPALRPAHNELYARWRKLVLSVVERAAAAGLIADSDPSVVAIRFTTLVDGAVIQLLTETPGTNIEQVRSLLAEAFWPPH
jgi:AcrR family transcriptional regulator